MRGAKDLARQALSLLRASRHSVPLHSHMQQRLLHSNGLTTAFTRQTHSVKLSSRLGAPSVPGCLAVPWQSRHHQDALPMPMLGHRSSWSPRTGLVNHVPAASAAFTASTPASSAHGDDEGPEGELHAVETAIRANALIFAAKLGVFFVSNSSAMLAEAVHSLVDIANQMLLRIGIIKAQRQPTETHPYGYARDQFIWPLISAVGIFCCGAGVSFVHGVTGLLEAHREIGDLYWNFVVLGVSGVLESHSLYVAVNTLRRRATQQGMGLLAYIRTGADPAAVAVMMEDGAAVAGLFVAGGCLALCQVTGAVYWDAIGSIAVSALLGVVAVTLIQRNRKWLIGKSMPKAQEDLILEHLANDSVIRQVSNIKSEELGVRQYRFQADIAFDGEELARRALDRCGRTRLFKALDAAIRRHDPHALDALLMQFAAVIVSTTGAEVDRLERDIMRLVPGTRWVDLETDRGKPARLSSLYNAAAAAVTAAQSHQQPQQQDATLLQSHELQQQIQQQQQQQGKQPLGPLDSISEQDHLADLTEYPLGSLMSFDSDVHDNVPEWIKAFAPAHSVSGSSSSSSSGGSGGSEAAPVIGPAGAAGRIGAADAELSGGNYLSQEQMHAIESGLFGNGGGVYKPFCDAMFDKVMQSASAGNSNERWDMQDVKAREEASKLQIADWERSAARSPTHSVRSGAGSRSGYRAVVPSPSGLRDDWGQQEKLRKVQELHDLEDTVMGPETDAQYKPFCESMFQKLHPDQPKLRPSAVASQQQQQQRLAQQQQQQQLQAKQQEDS